MTLGVGKRRHNDLPGVSRGQVIFAALLSTQVLCAILITLSSVESGSLSSDGSIHQGDIILGDGNTTTISGRLDINGSLILKAGATLVLQDAQINILQTSNYQHRLILGSPQDDPTGKGALIQAHNSTIGSNMWIRMDLYGASSLDFLNVTTNKMPTYAYNASRIEANECHLTLLYCWGDSTAAVNGTYVLQTTHLRGSSGLVMAGSRTDSLVAREFSTATLENCTIDLYLLLHVTSSDCLIKGLAPGHVACWDFVGNSSAIPGTAAAIPSVTLRDTTVASWGFEFHGDSKVEIGSCELRQALAWDSTEMTIVDTPLYHQVLGGGDSKVHMQNSSCNLLSAYDDAYVRLIDSVFGGGEIEEAGTVVSESHLQVLVIDSEDKAVPQAWVEARHRNETVAAAAQTGPEGRATLLLLERTLTPAGTSVSQPYSVHAGYGTHQTQAEVNLTDTRFTTLRLEGLAIAEMAMPATLPVAVVDIILISWCRSRREKERSASLPA